MLKATCIVGSARANGSCNYLVDSVIRGMQESGIETKKYCIGEMKIQYCCGQKKCYTDGKCVYNDDVKQIVEDMIESDIVVMAAPSYWAGVPGQLKVFFDRCTPYGDTDPNLKKTKKGIASFEPAVRSVLKEKIERNAAKEGPCQEDWQMLKLHSEYTVLFVKTFELLEKGDEEQKVEAANQWIDLIRRNELAAQKVLDVHNSSIVLQGRWKMNNFAI